MVRSWLVLGNNYHSLKYNIRDLHDVQEPRSFYKWLPLVTPFSFSFFMNLTNIIFFKTIFFIKNISRYFFQIFLY